MSARGCGCCECQRGVTPLAPVNRAGLSSIAYRAGTHASFLDSMLARLSSRTVASLSPLTTREVTDPSIAFLDAWATAADVLTFYNERIANEGYLRTALERRSLVNLGRLVGYELRPGVAASAYLAYTIDKDHDIVLPAGARVTSIPAPEDDGPRTFETSEPLQASWLWNELRPRATEPRPISLADVESEETVYKIRDLYLAGTATNLRPRDLLLFVFGPERERQVARTVLTVTPDFPNDRTLVELTEPAPFLDKYIALVTKVAESVPAAANHLERSLKSERVVLILLGAAFGPKEVEARMDNLSVVLDDPNAVGLKTFFDQQLADIRSTQIQTGPPGTLKIFGDAIASLRVGPSSQPSSARALDRTLDPLAADSEVRAKLLQAVVPEIRSVYAAAFANIVFRPDSSQVREVYALRDVAAPFGFFAPTPTETTPQGPAILNVAATTAEHTIVAPDTNPKRLHLDNIYDVAPRSWIIVRAAHDAFARAIFVESAEAVARSNYLLNQKVTRLSLASSWVYTDDPQSTAAPAPPVTFNDLRTTTIHVRSERLPLAESPIALAVDGASIVLDGYYPGLQTGRWVILIGERTDIPLTHGVIGRELLMISGIDHVPSPGQPPRTRLTFAESMAYRYKRATVILKGNVVHATDGESRDEVLGGGDATKALQQFALKTTPLTYVSAATPSGIASTLVIRVDDIQWDEVESFTGLGPTAHVFTTKTTDDGQTIITFGTGVHGARLPSGAGNVVSRYRKGIGRAGNLKAGQLTNPQTKPLGTKGVDNPMPASGGGDPETRDQARVNIPVALHALDRLVSVRDYGDFARTFGGVAKAAAAALPGKLSQLVHVTVAGDGDALITETSDLYKNLRTALLTYGDAAHQIVLAARERIVVALKARVRIDRRFLWDKVEPDIRATLNDRFGFERRALGQPLFESDVIAAIHNVPGVDYVDLDTFFGISEAEIVPPKSGAPPVLPPAPSPPPKVRCISARPARVENGRLHAAQLAYIAAEVADTVVLQEIR